MTLFPEFNINRVNNKHAAVGVSAPQSQRAVSVDEVLFECWKIRRLSAADGCRGRQELNCVSGKFISFIYKSFQF